MTIDTEELRQRAQEAHFGHMPLEISGSEVLELLDRLEATERAWKESNKSCWDLTEKVIPNIREQLESAEKERDDVAQQLVQAEIGKRKLDAECDALRAKITEMEQQEPAGTLHDDGYFVWRRGCRPYESNYVGWMMKLYALPGAQNVPKEAIAKILAEVMDIAVSNGANSRSMPDEYVEVAKWLCGIHVQPAQRQQSGAKGE